MSLTDDRAGRPTRSPQSRSHDPQMTARVAGVAAVIGAVVLVALIVLGASSGYTLSADFQDSGGLVPGNQVMIGPAIVGSIQSIGLAPNGLARIKFSVDSDVGADAPGDDRPDL